MDDLANRIEELTHEIEVCYQEGVIFYPSTIKTIEISISNLQMILKDLKNPKIQKYFNQVKS